MKKLISLAVAVVILGLSGLALADTAAPAAGGSTVGTGSKRTPVIRHRMRRQKSRIKQGVKSGELTKDETKSLAADHKQIRDEVKDAKSDGTVTKDERKQIHKDLNGESKKIYELKHNDEKQPAAQ